jgi:hypothetical protein
VTLIGGGGVAPVSSGVTDKSALLKDATWTGLAGATINLKVLKCNNFI